MKNTEGYTINELKNTVGQRCRAFHPKRMGVVNHGTIIKVGSRYLYVDFGSMLGGVYRVHPRDIVELLGTKPRFF
jgi:hypothetical protein